MAYTPTTWVDDSPPAIDAENLNKIEQGVADLDASVTTLNSEVSTLINVSDEGSVYVSTKGWANDGNNGLTPGTPLASITAARDLIGDDVGRRIILGSGDHAATPDGDLVMSAEGQGIIAPMGPGATRILMSGDGTWGVKAQHSLCTLEGFQLVNSGELQYAVGVSTPTDTATASSGEINRVWVIPDAPVVAAFTLGPDHAGSSSVDLATTVFRHCVAFPNNAGVPATGILTYGFLFGNGTPGNVLANECHSCSVVAAAVSVGLNGAGIVWFAGQWGYNTETDIRYLQGSGTPSVFYAVRGEAGAMAFDAGYVGQSLSPVKLDNCEFSAYDPTDGETIIHDDSGTLILDGGSYRVVGGNARVEMDHFSAGGRSFEARGVAYDSADPYRGITAAVTRHTSGTLMDVAGVPTSNPGADASGGWNDYSNDLTISGTGWALGNAVVLARWAASAGIVSLDITITWGSTSTFGTGGLEISLPADALPAATVGIAAGRATFLDSGFNFWDLNVLVDQPSGKLKLYSQSTNGEYGGPHTASNPATVDATDSLSVSATYEAA